MFLCWVGYTPVHVVCYPDEDAVIIVTVFRPSDENGADNWRTRR